MNLFPFVLLCNLSTKLSGHKVMKANIQIQILRIARIDINLIGDECIYLTLC